MGTALKPGLRVSLRFSGAKGGVALPVASAGHHKAWNPPPAPRPPHVLSFYSKAPAPPRPLPLGQVSSATVALSGAACVRASRRVSRGVSRGVSNRSYVWIRQVSRRVSGARTTRRVGSRTPVAFSDAPVPGPSGLAAAGPAESHSDSSRTPSVPSPSRRSGPLALRTVQYVPHRCFVVLALIVFDRGPLPPPPSPTPNPRTRQAIHKDGGLSFGSRRPSVAAEQDCHRTEHEFEGGHLTRRAAQLLGQLQPGATRQEWRWNSGTLNPLKRCVQRNCSPKCLKEAAFMELWGGGGGGVKARG